MFFTYLKLSAPGKIILCGEHAVVYGKKAIASAIDLRTNLSAFYCKDEQLVSYGNKFSFNFKDINQSVFIDKIDFDSIINEYSNLNNNLDGIVNYLTSNNNNNTNKQLTSIKFMLIALNRCLKWSNLNSLVVELSSEIPLGSGLGSSASFSVCLASFFLILSEKIRIDTKENSKFSSDDLNLINLYAFQLEKLFHGKPSGIDNTVSTYGHYVLFQKGAIETINSNLELPILVVNSCIPKQTMTQVDKVRRLYEKHTPILEQLMNTIESLVEKFYTNLKENKLDDLDDLIVLNQGLLYSLQVSNPELNSIINLAQLYGGFAAKITGAGGGGCCFVLLNESTSTTNSQNNTHKLIEILKENKFLPFSTRLGSDGARIDKIDFI